MQLEYELTPQDYINFNLNYLAEPHRKDAASGSSSVFQHCSFCFLPCLLG